jgi:hypothetical protein
MKPFYSLAEAFQRGIYPVKQPSPETTVSYYIRVYPQLDVEELLKADALENLRSEDGSFNFQNPHVSAHTYAWTASLDYCNEDSGEIVHRTELTRATKEELYSALHAFASEITDGRQRTVYKRMLAENEIPNPNRDK